MPPATTTPRGAEGRAGVVLPAPGREGKDSGLVQAMFDAVAPRYDLANTILSLGLDAGWRRVAAAAAEPMGALILDAAAGTGRLGDELARRGARRVVALDLSWEMVAVGARRAPGHAWLSGDALRLPFRDATFDAVTVGFGLRNLPDPRQGLAEFARVTRPGGRVVVLEFSVPRWPLWRALYRRYLIRLLPPAASLVSSHGPAYRYLVDSILAWPGRDELAGWARDAGWDGVRYRDLTGGIVAVHAGRRAATAAPRRR